MTKTKQAPQEVRFMHDTVQFTFSRKQWEAAVLNAVKNHPPVIGPTAKHVLVLRAGKKTWEVTPMYVHQFVLGRPLVKESKSGQTIHPAVNPKQVVDKVVRHLGAFGVTYKTTKRQK